MKLVIRVLIIVLASCAHSSPHAQQPHVGANAVDDCAVSAAPVIDAVGGVASAVIGIPRQFVSAASTIYELHRAARCSAAVAEAAPIPVPAQTAPAPAEPMTLSTTIDEPQRPYGAVEALMRR